MRLSWRNLFKSGKPEREAFEDMHDLLIQEVKTDTLQVSFDAVNKSVEFNHTLNRIPRFFVLTECTVPGIIYATVSDRQSWTNRVIVLRSNTVLGGKICVH